MTKIREDISRIKHELAYASLLYESVTVIDNGGDRIRAPPLAIRIKPMARAELIIKEIYRNRFKVYNPFYFDLGFEFEMNSWIPVTVCRQDGSKYNGDPLQFVADSLAEYGLTIITGNETKMTLIIISFAGDAGVGKTLLTQKIAFDYANSEESRWNIYDIVLID